MFCNLRMWQVYRTPISEGSQGTKRVVTDVEMQEVATDGNTAGSKANPQGTVSPVCCPPCTPLIPILSFFFTCTGR